MRLELKNISFGFIKVKLLRKGKFIYTSSG